MLCSIHLRKFQTIEGPNNVLYLADAFNLYSAIDVDKIVILHAVSSCPS